ncbi:serine hydrolase domain-containing protein [Roseisalinus antarcticus]|uniref:Putative penicillin-binding protein PbpX n=1 Tax=Roseisalinus antarcticus TaxID=254357 RepID=A0A1Y5T8Z7_9RHOB|nr:serine hydrolase domain-containing protein [Roseisalinus antarcticus]SLN58073.1 Putative penicillin-binding protein PbpX [Roseisalinus antarcticus]
MVLIRLVVILALWAGSAAADARALEAAWRGWVAQAGVTGSTIAITRDGQLVRSLGIGEDPEARAPLASLSKSITGACILALERQGLLSTSQTVGQLFSGTGMAMTQGASRITVAELLTHSSGLMRDSTQGRPSPWRARGGDRTLEVAQTAMSRNPGPKQFVYNNENYAVLGAVIQVVAGENPALVCPRLVLAPLGLDAAVSREFGGGVSWGGNEMSAPDFARFAASLAPRRDWPRLPMGGGVSYGPGVMLKEGGGRTTLWHFGSWCFLFGQSAGAYFFQLADSWGVTVTYNRCLSQSQTQALDVALASAIR